MKKLISLAASLVAAVLLCVASVSPSYAVLKTVFVSGAGSDGNPCSLTQPCRTIGYAVGTVATGGTVSCLDAGPYDEASPINSPFTVDCRGVVYAVGNSFAFSVQTSGTLVTFRNVIFDGALAGTGAVTISGGSRVIFENCTFQNFTAAPGTAILFAPSAAVAYLTIRDSRIREQRPGRERGRHHYPATGIGFCTCRNRTDDGHGQYLRHLRQ